MMRNRCKTIKSNILKTVIHC